MEMAFQKLFLGENAPRPPRLRVLAAPCSYSRLFFSNQLPTSNFIEAPDIVWEPGSNREIGNFNFLMCLGAGSRQYC